MTALANQAYIYDLEVDKIQKVVSELIAYDVVKIDSNPQTLEELFMHHYSQGRG